MLKIVASNRFKKDLKLAVRRNLDLQKLNGVVDMLARQEPLPAELRDHSLIGDYAGFRECHIEPDWLLVYRIENDALELYLFRTGTHSDLF
jgi:mRNA interferase YafQ